MRIAIVVIIFVLSSAALVSSASASGQVEPFSLVCFKEGDLVQAFELVENGRQIQHNDFSRDTKRKINKLQCDIVNIQFGSSYDRHGFRQNKNGLIAPLYEVRYGTTGQRMFAIDVTFQASLWELKRVRQHNSYYDVVITKIFLVPKNCGMLHQVLYQYRKGNLPDYIQIPKLNKCV